MKTTPDKAAGNVETTQFAYPVAPDDTTPLQGRHQLRQKQFHNAQLEISAQES